MAKSPKSKTLAAVHETMRDLHAAGAIDAGRMREFDDMCLAPAGGAQPDLEFAVFKDTRGQWRWNLRASSGKIIAEAGEGYRLKRDCLAAIELVRSAARAAIAA